MKPKKKPLLPVDIKLPERVLLEDGVMFATLRTLDELEQLGITAIEVLPLAQCPGKWNWGYDGVNYFAPRNSFGRPDELKRFVNECHARSIAVIGASRNRASSARPGCRTTPAPADSTSSPTEPRPPPCSEPGVGHPDARVRASAAVRSPTPPDCSIR